MTRQSSLGCPSHGADHLWDGGDPTVLQEAVLALLEDAGVPTERCDRIMIELDEFHADEMCAADERRAEGR